jgi:hypothetical protein
VATKPPSASIPSRPRSCHECKKAFEKLPMGSYGRAFCTSIGVIVAVLAVGVALIPVWGCDFQYTVCSQDTFPVCPLGICVAYTVLDWVFQRWLVTIVGALISVCICVGLGVVVVSGPCLVAETMCLYYEYWSMARPTSAHCTHCKGSPCSTECMPRPY